MATSAKKIISAVLSLSISWFSCYPAWAETATTETVQQYTSDGQSLAGEIFPDFNSMVSSNEGDNTINMYPGDPERSSALDLGQLFPGSDTSPITLESLYGDQSAYESATGEVQSILSTEESSTGDAYRFMGESRKPRPDLTNDPIFDRSKEVYADVFSNEFSECELVTKYTPTTMVTHVPDYRTCQKTYKPAVGTCTITHDYMNARAIQWLSGSGGISNCGEGCLDLWLGRVGNNYIGGNCIVYEQDMTIQVVDPDSIISATLAQAVYDDRLQVYVAGEKVWEHDSLFPPETTGRCELSTSWNKAPNTDVTAQFKKTADPIQVKLRLSVAGEGEGYVRVRIHYDTSVINKVDQWLPESCLESAKAIDGTFCSGSYSCTTPPPSYPCVQTPNGVTVCADHLAPAPLDGIDNMCQAVTVTVDNCDYNVGQMECWVDTQGVEHCPYNDGSVATTCEAYEDDPGCAYIKTQCVEGATNENGVCFVFEDIYDCGQDVVVETSNMEEVYNCEGEVRCMGGECVEEDTLSDTNFAEASAMLNVAQFAVQDMNCADASNEPGSVSSDGDWVVADPNDPTVETTGAAPCTVFQGDPYECKTAVGGWQNCCESPTTVSLTDYLNLLMATNKIASAKMWLGGTVSNPVYGPYTAVTDAVSSGAQAVFDATSSYAADAWQWVTKTGTQAWQSITGTVGDVAVKTAASSGGTTATAAATTDTAASVVTQSIQQLTDKLASWVYDTFGEAAYGALFSPGTGATVTTTTVQDGVATSVTEEVLADGTKKVTTEVASSAATDGTTSVVQGTSLGGTVGLALNMVMWAYTAYVVANLLVQIIWECEMEEFELGTKKQLKVCTYLGSYCASEVLGACVEKRESYCCYSSPLSRILNEQIRAQLGMAYGSLKAPDCSGVTIDQLKAVNWDLINLDEWIGIMTLTGNLPSPENGYLDTLSLDGLTGSGNALDIEEPRPDAAQRALDRYPGEGLQNLNSDLRSRMWEQAAPSQ